MQRNRRDVPKKKSIEVPSILLHAIGHLYFGTAQRYI